MAAPGLVVRACMDVDLRPDRLVRGRRMAVRHAGATALAGDTALYREPAFERGLELSVLPAATAPGGDVGGGSPLGLHRLADGEPVAGVEPCRAATAALSIVGDFCRLSEPHHRAAEPGNRLSR